MASTALERAFLLASASTSEESAVAVALSRCLHLAREKWPRAVVSEVSFADRLGRAAGLGGVDSLDGVESDDLYLVCGCLEGDQASVSYLSDLVRRGVGKWASGIPVDSDDLAQRILTRLLVPGEGDPPRLARYEGRAPLVAYLKTVARNLAVSLSRGSERNEASPSPAMFLAAAGNPEHDAIRLEFGEAFSRALDDAFRSLESRQRAVVAMHYADGVELDAIAKVYRVHRVTVSRWLADARVAVFETTKQRLRGALGLTESEFEGALRIIRSQIEISLSTLAVGALDPGAPKKRPLP